MTQGHTHESWDHPGRFKDRAKPLKNRDFSQRAFTVGIGGPVAVNETAAVPGESLIGVGERDLVAKIADCEIAAAQISRCADRSSCDRVANRLPGSSRAIRNQ